MKPDTTTPGAMTEPAVSLPGLSLAWRIAVREMRVGLKGFRVFLACLALGVAAIAAVGSLSESVKSGLMAAARVLLGGDVDLRTQHQPISNEQQTYLQANATRLSSPVEMKAMDQTHGPRALGELKGVDAL